MVSDGGLILGWISHLDFGYLVLQRGAVLNFDSYGPSPAISQ